MEIVFAGAAIALSSLLAVMIGRAGWIKAFTPIASLAGSGLVWVSDVPRSGVRALGVFELAAATVLAAAPLVALTPLSNPIVTLLGVSAALGVAALMAVAHLFHLRRGEATHTWMTNLAFGALAILSASAQFVAG